MYLRQMFWVEVFVSFLPIWDVTTSGRRYKEEGFFFVECFGELSEPLAV